MNIYNVGTAVEIAGAFEDLNGDFADPSFIRATLITPSGNTVDLTGTVQRRGIGDYFLLYVPIESGYFQYRLAGYGDVVSANEGSFYAETSFPYAAIIFTPSGELDTAEQVSVVAATLSHFLNIPAGELDISSDPPFTGNFVVVPNPAPLALAGNPVSPLVVTGEQPNTQNVLLQGFAPLLGLNGVTGQAQAVLVGAAPSLNTNLLLVPVTAGISAAGTTPSLNGKLIIIPNATVLTLVPTVPPLNTTEQPQPNALSISSTAPVLNQGFTIAGGAGAGVLSGVGALNIFGLNLPPLVGAASLAGIAPALGIGSPRNVNQGTLALTGNAPIVNYTSSIAPPVGSLALAGNLALPNVSFMPLAGSFALTGIAAALLRGQLITPSAGALAATGITPALTRRDTIAPPAGSLILVGNVGNSGVPPVIVQQASNMLAVDQGTVQQAFASNVAAGNLIVVVAWGRNSSTDVVYTAGMLTGDGGNTAVLGTVQLDAQTANNDPNANSCPTAIWSVPVISPGTCTMNISMTGWSGGTTRSMFAIFEVSLADISGARVAATAMAIPDSTTAPASGNVATGGAGIVFAVCGTIDGPATTFTENGAYTLAVEVENGGFIDGSIIYRIVSINTTTAPSWATSAAINASICSVAYKAAKP